MVIFYLHFYGGKCKSPCAPEPTNLTVHISGQIIDHRPINSQYQKTGWNTDEMQQIATCHDGLYKIYEVSEITKTNTEFKVASITILKTRKTKLSRKLTVATAIPVIKRTLTAFKLSNINQSSMFAEILIVLLSYTHSSFVEQTEQIVNWTNCIHFRV